MKCNYCNRKVNNKGALTLHEKSCAQNPNRIQKIGVKHKKWDELYPLDKVMIVNSTYARHCLKRRIISENIIEYKCSICGIGPEWNNKPMPLILDHINGINNDNRLENLRFVCSNCDCQLDTYKSRNKKGE